MGKVTKKNCIMCEDNFYNGNNHLGVEECWRLETAVMVKKIPVPVHMPPPYKSIKAQMVPSCYRRKGMTYVKPESLDLEGYWRL